MIHQGNEQGASPPPPLPLPSSVPRRRVNSRSDLELAVPLSVEIWNFVLPTVDAAGESDGDDNDPQSGSATKSASWITTPSSASSVNATDLAIAKNATTRKTSTTKWYKLRHQTSILEEVEMQMVVQENASKAVVRNTQSKDSDSKELAESSETTINKDAIENDSEQDESNSCSPTNGSDSKEDLQTIQSEDIVLYRSVNDNGLTVNPSWFHLQEKLLGIHEWINLHRDTYESLEFRFSLVDKRKENESTPSHFLTVPGHPSQLVSLGKNNNTLMNLKMSTTLPINTVVVHYSDRTSRILPAHYQLLAEQQPQIFPRGAEDKSLSLSTWSSAGNHHHHHQSQSSLVPRWTQDHDKDSQKADSGKKKIETPRRQRFRDDAFKCLDDVSKGNETDSGELSQEEPPMTSSYEDQEEAEETREDVDVLPSRTLLRAQVLQRERQRLLDSIEEELQAYEQEKQALAEAEIRLRDELTAEWNQFEEQTLQIREATQQELCEIQRLDLLIEMHRIRLVRGLEECYPVAEAPPVPAPTTASTMSSYLMSSSSSGNMSSPTNSGNGPTLRGWTLPSAGSLFSSATDDELSAVLGALSHVVLQLAKYLGIPLRYRIFSNSSRSAIQDDRGIIHPLFLARPVEREQVAQGLVLLDRNVMCIAQSRGIAIHPSKQQDSSLQTSSSDVHIFEKVRQLYRATIDGPTVLP